MAVAGLGGARDPQIVVLLPSGPPTPPLQASLSLSLFLLSPSQVIHFQTVRGRLLMLLEQLLFSSGRLPTAYFTLQARRASACGAVTTRSVENKPWIFFSEKTRDVSARLLIGIWKTF